MDEDNQNSQGKGQRSILKPEDSLCHDLTAHPGETNLGVYFGRSKKHFNRNRDISEPAEAGEEHMLSGSQRASGGKQIHVQVKDKVKEFKE